MSPEVSDLLEKALALPVEERAALANTLLDSLEATNQPVQEAWDEEVARPIADLKAGKSVAVPWEQLHRELLAMVNERSAGSIRARRQTLRGPWRGIRSEATRPRPTSSRN
jgi:putative addiction module component (TIGR02574 family)